MSDDLQRLVIDWYKAYQRDLPWRKCSPWGVLVSEFMLQQTQVSRVLPKWTEWMERWPTPQSLAKANKADVITAWGGLGYPRRALRLHETARIIDSQHCGLVPSNYEELIALPGIGDYSANAILAFAYHQPVVVLDINIRRFFARLIDGRERPAGSVSKAERTLRRELVPRREGDIWAAATMEYGALICTAQSPKCDLCILANRCAWKINGFPTSQPRSKQATFQGSDRQCRGLILRQLRQNPVLEFNEISNLWANLSQLEKALQTLIADGFIEATGDQRYQLVQEG